MQQNDAPIRILPEHLINQIAAGEVIERPASVVKELLDNSLDAGASQIDIDIERGGTQLIRVQDNGRGIKQSELTLAITRHATSKITRLSDLHTLLTMGFRGEALPSIASVSRLTIVSNHSEADHAWQVRQAERESPDEKNIEPASHPQGTRIECRDLFYNTPARRKFLRSERTEFYQILQWVRQVAITHHRVGFTLRHNGRVILRASGCTNDQIESRIKAILGTGFLQQATRIDREFQGMSLLGWVGRASAAKTINDSQFFALNSRVIRDKRISHAINKAYEGYLPEGRHAVYALMLTMDPALVDINVHPAKTEVRFVNMRDVHDAVFASISEALRDPVLGFESASTQTVTDRQFYKPEPPPSQASIHSISPKVREHVPAYKRTVPGNFTSAVNSADQLNKTNSEQRKSEEERNPQICWQIGEQLVINLSLISNETGILILLTEPAFEQISVIRWLDQLEDGAIKSAPLLFPRKLELEEEVRKQIQQYKAELNQLGFHFLIREDHILLAELPISSSLNALDGHWDAFLSYLPDKTECLSYLAQCQYKFFTRTEIETALCKLDIIDAVRDGKLSGRLLSESDLTNSIIDPDQFLLTTAKSEQSG